MLELIVQQTNSTVTTTVLQQTSGLSSSDLISLFSGGAMIAVTIALAYYARVAIVEAKKDRRKDSIEKQLEKLYNPLFEILERGEVHPELGGMYRKVLNSDIDQILSILLNYGHYLGSTERDRMKKALDMRECTLGDKHVLLRDDWDPTGSLHKLEVSYSQCLSYITEKREQLTAELKGLT